MKICTFRYAGSRRAGVVLDEDRVVDINLAYAAHLHIKGRTRVYELANASVPSSVIEIIEGGVYTLDGCQEALKTILLRPGIKGPKGEQIEFSLDEVELTAPIPRPGKILCVAINNRQGFERAIKPEGEFHPLYFAKFNTCVTGPYDSIEIPDIGVVGSEIEVAAIIGKKGKNIPVQDADKYIYGYTVHNDITAHEIREKQEWIISVRPEGDRNKITYQGRYKCFDTFAPMGPWLVTRDEIGDMENHKMSARINGNLCQIGSTSDMTFKFPQLISYMSTAHTLEPGDVISGGTVVAAPGWVMSKIDLRKIGGVLESEVEGIGILKNPIKAI